MGNRVKVEKDMPTRIACVTPTVKDMLNKVGFAACETLYTVTSSIDDVIDGAQNATRAAVRAGVERG